MATASDTKLARLQLSATAMDTMAVARNTEPQINSQGVSVELRAASSDSQSVVATLSYETSTEVSSPHASHRD